MVSLMTQLGQATPVAQLPLAPGAPDLDIGHFPKLPRVRVRLAAHVDVTDGLGRWATQSSQDGPELAWVTAEDFKKWGFP